jgi:phage terminase large subunit-like protein
MGLFARFASHPALIPFVEFCERLRIPLFPWQQDAFGEATTRTGNRFTYRLAGISAPRGDGKSLASATVGLWMLTGRPRADIISSALDLDGAKVVLDHAAEIVRSHEALTKAIDIRANALLMSETDARWTVSSREHTASRGRHPDLVLYDEAGWARDDELFSSLLAGQASVSDPLMLVTSTVGRRRVGPLWTIKQLAEHGDPGTCWHWHSENQSPRVTKDFLDRQRRILLPAAFAREHQNQWVDAADSFTTAADVDLAMAAGIEQVDGRRGVSAAVYVDIGAVHDASVIALGYRENDTIVIARLMTFQGSRSAPVQIKAITDALRRLAAEWRIASIRIESWQGLSAVQELQRAGLPVDLFTPTSKTNAEEWPVLAQVLSAHRLVLFPHARLREELLNLVCEIGPQGVRVIDRGRIHQDHAVAVRGVCATLLRLGVDRETVAFNRACLAAGDDVPNPYWRNAPTAHYRPFRDRARGSREGAWEPLGEDYP